MDARQDYHREASIENGMALTVERLLSEASNQRNRHYAGTPERPFSEEPDGQEDSSNDEVNLGDDKNLDDEGDEYARDMLDDPSDGESVFQPGEDSEESDDPDDEMNLDGAHDTDLQDMLDDLSDGISDFELGEDAEEYQLNGESDTQDNISDDEMTVDDETDEDLEGMFDPLSDGPSDDEHGEETEQQDQQNAAPGRPCDTSVCANRNEGMHLLRGNVPDHDSPTDCCDEEIPLRLIEQHLPENVVQRYREKLVEHETRDRTYCSNRQCLKFIPPKNISDSGEPCYRDEEQCPACNEITCTNCKNKAHTGACEQQVERAQALALAESEGWKRCARCGHLIERNGGCTHLEWEIWSRIGSEESWVLQHIRLQLGDGMGDGKAGAEGSLIADACIAQLTSL
uniref:IBR domain-containing protein n=1 Tax=Fusarium oxysporum (strain Fo5176) TaxID=660025 RepID=A0A0D2XPE9_FUSOF